MPRGKKNPVVEGSETEEKVVKKSSFTKVTLKLPNKVADHLTNHFNNNPGLSLEDFYSFMLYVGVQCSSKNAINFAYKDYSLFMAENPFPDVEPDSLTAAVIDALERARNRRGVELENISIGSPNDPGGYQDEYKDDLE